MTKQKALEGIRVLDLSRILAGPFCTQILGDLGADILKIEKPLEGDDTRTWGPPFLKDKDGNDTNESAYYLSINRNKKSVAIDISKKEGQELIHRLVEKCDILIENFKVGGLKKYGLDYESLKTKHPKLIYCSITGFGQNGPLASESGYDFLAQAMAGLMASTGDKDGPPMKTGVAVSDILTGLNAAIGILAALHHREKTGQGQHIDLALTDCTLSTMTNIAQYYLTSGNLAPRLGNAHSTIVPYQQFEAEDGHIIIAVGNDSQFRKLCAVLGKPEWADDPRFAKNSSRVKNRGDLVLMVAALLKTKPIAYWLEKCADAAVPAGPVNTMDRVFAMEQIKARDMQISMKHDLAPDAISLVGSPLKLSETPVSYKKAPPYLGRDTQEVLEKSLGMSADEVMNLQKHGIIHTGSAK
ncbi:MAG: CaiB/BaiF CoA transferase family protein [Alphaproteobacteria bacterium]